ncbi:MAG: hypothetical protein H7Z21_02870 [Hymenobacter sp.]|nr:hypothetical protein [Hymenobacter sp.]
MLDLALRTLAFAGGLVLIIVTVSAAIRSFVLPRNESVKLNSFVFQPLRLLFDLAAARQRTFAARDRVQAHYAPVALVTLPVVWLTVVTGGFTLIYWGLGEGEWLQCYLISGSSLLTLGTHKASGPAAAVFTFAEATLGLLLLTLLISYLPTIYQAFSRREIIVARLELRAGTPPAAATLLTWLSRSGSLLDDTAQWELWEEWFVEIEESHTSLPILSFFRSPQPGRSWVSTAALILDTAALMFSAVVTERDQQAELTFKAGCLSVNRVYRFFNESLRSTPNHVLPDNDLLEEPGRPDFDRTCESLLEAGLTMHPDRDEAWRQYCELRSRYATALEFLARLTMAPEAKSV